VLAQQAALAAKAAELAAKEAELAKREAGLAAMQDLQRSLLCTAPLPAYWEPYSEDENPEAVKFVVLPFEGRFSGESQMVVLLPVHNGHVLLLLVVLCLQ
jgi:hypothetical protein